MTNAPYLLPKARARLPHGPPDGLRPHVPRRARGRLRQGPPDGQLRRGLRGRAISFTREAQDDFALASLSRALGGQQRRHVSPGKSRRSPSPGARATSSCDKDEQPAKASPDKIPLLKPAFRKDGTVTAANSSSISDGAAALVLMRRSTAEKRGLDAAGGDRRPRDARAGAGTVHDGAGRRDRASCTRRPAGRRRDVDLFEINEAFAVVTMAAMKEHGLAARQGQRPRRRLRAGPSDRRVGRAHRGHAARRAAQARRASAASPACASAAARRPRWRSSSARIALRTTWTPARRAAAHSVDNGPMPGLDNFLLFAAASVLLALTPGPNLLYLVSRTLCQGRPAGIVSLAGTASGSSCTSSPRPLGSRRCSSPCRSPTTRCAWPAPGTCCGWPGTPSGPREGAADCSRRPACPTPRRAGSSGWGC